MKIEIKQSTSPSNRNALRRKAKNENNTTDMKRVKIEPNANFSKISSNESSLPTL